MAKKKKKNRPTDRRFLKRVFIYMRYSSNMQNPMSIDAQRRAIREFCKKQGYIIEKEFVDEAKSVTTDDREAFQQMMKEAKKAGIYAVVVHKFDRFSRNMNNAHTYECMLEKLGVKLISVTEPNDASPASVFTRNMMFSLSDYFSRNLATEVQKGKKEAAYNCWHVGGLPPYGYDVGEDRKYIINDKESRVVKLIFQMYINDYSYKQIADYLNKNGYTTKKDLPFNKNSFSSILENAERYTGVYIYNRAASKYNDGTRNSHRYKDDSEIIRIPDGMPRIIDDETYNKFLTKKEANREIAGTYHSKRYYLLNGLIVCGECGKAYTGNTSFSGRNKTEYATYRCGAYRDGCKNKAVNIKYLNDFVLDLLLDIIFDEKNYRRIIKALNEKFEKRNAMSVNKKKYSIESLLETSRYQILKLQTSSYKMIIGAIHNHSKPHSSEDKQRVELTALHQDIIQQEREHMTKNSIIIGDLNINPFDKICVEADTLFAIPYKSEIKEPTAIRAGREYEKFYNPSWKFLESNEMPYTSYRYDTSDLVDYYWNMFDQVIIRPRLINAFDYESFKILTKTEHYELILNEKPNINNYSDHLPIFCKFKEEKIK